MRNWYLPVPTVVTLYETVHCNYCCSVSKTIILSFFIFFIFKRNLLYHILDSLSNRLMAQEGFSRRSGRRFGFVS